MERIGAIVSRIAARLKAAHGDIQEERASVAAPIDKNGCTFGKEPEHAARCPAPS